MVTEDICIEMDGCLVELHALILFPMIRFSIHSQYFFGLHPDISSFCPGLSFVLLELLLDDFNTSLWCRPPPANTTCHFHELCLAFGVSLFFVVVVVLRLLAASRNSNWILWVHI